MGFWGCGFGGMEEKKSRFAEKKLRLWRWRGAAWVSRVVCLYPGGGATTDPPRLTAIAVAVSMLRFGFASLAWCCPQYAISGGGSYWAMSWNGVWVLSVA